MALINCKECGTEFSSLAVACPKCGAPTTFTTGELLPANISSNLPPAVPPPLQQQPFEQPQYQQINIHHHHENKQIRYVSTLLFLGVIFFPYIFVWFLFRNGHTTFARVAGVSWLIFCIFAVGYADHKKDSYSSSASGETTSNTQNPDIEVSAQQLFADYNRNEVAADNKYKGKLLMVSGTIDSINKDIGDDPYINLSTGNMFMNVRAELQDSEIQKAAGLQKEQPITLKCTGGTMLVGSPTLRDCIIVEMSQPQNVQVTSTEQNNQDIDDAAVAEAANIAAQNANVPVAQNQPPVEDSTQHEESPAITPDSPVTQNAPNTDPFSEQTSNESLSTTY